MMQSMTGSKALALVLLLATVSACNDDGNGLRFGLDSTQNNPPRITGTPRTKARIGERYQFTPRATDPDGEPLQFEVTNLPRWAKFDGHSGRLLGTPDATDVGNYANVTVSVSDGRSKIRLRPFNIRVEPKKPASQPPSPETPPETPPPPPPPSAGGSFRFAEIPEIVFVRGYSSTEHLGIFHIDTLNRWTPGDLDNSSGWMPRVATQLEVSDGAVTGVSYDPSTGILSYDGSGAGTETARVRLTAPSTGAASAEFNVRVLAPTLAWGVDAASRFPGIGQDSGSVRWDQMRQRLRKGASYANPNVLIITPGRYSADFYLPAGTLNLYILGEPGGRPVLVGDAVNLDGLETAYLKNLELNGTTVVTSVNLPGRTSNVYVTQVYQHDSTRDDNGFKASAGRPNPGLQWRYWFWNFHGSQMGWGSNLRHQFYIEGRLDSHLDINNIRITGAKQCSEIKVTRPFVSIRNSYLSAVLDERNLALGMRADKTVDIASATESVIIYNNDMVGAFTNARWGTSNGLVFFHARRPFWGSDSPAYPDVSWDPPVSSVQPGFAPLGFTSGPETYVNPAFWDTVRSHDIVDPGNPYSYKKYVAYNRFRWLDENGRRQSVFRDDGTAPREAAWLGSAEEVWGSAPSSWSERSVTFFANNSYEGWTIEDMRDPRRWFHLDFYAMPSLVTRVGPGPWPYPPPPRSVVFVGGERRPDQQAEPIELPDWFRL